MLIARVALLLSFGGIAAFSPVSPDVSSTVQSDEEYLSLQEEAMEVRDSPCLTKRVHFKEPPSFQVRVSSSVCKWFLLDVSSSYDTHLYTVVLLKVVPRDQGVTEGQDVVISAKIRGQPKPVVHW